MANSPVRLVTAALFVAAASAAVASSGGEPLAGDRLRDAVAGKRIYLSVPFGGEFPLYYGPDGRVDGSGEAVGLGRFLKPTDSGRWWVQGDRICQRWQEWYKGKTFCFTLARVAPDRLAWFRDDGEKGVARVGR